MTHCQSVRASPQTAPAIFQQTLPQQEQGHGGALLENQRRTLQTPQIRRTDSERWGVGKEVRVTSSDPKKHFV